MSTLQDNLDEIKRQKDTYLTPNNIRAGVTALGITGTYEGSGQAINNQDKMVTPLKSLQTITADNGYTGLGTVTVNAVTSAIDQNITSGNIKNGVNILGIIGVYEGSGGTSNLKLFKTEEAMRAASSQNGDLAVVYDPSAIVNWGPNTKSNYLIFPATVNLPAQTTYSIYFMMYSNPVGIDWEGHVNRTVFEIESPESETFVVRYTSTDGIHYTRVGNNGSRRYNSYNYLYIDEYDVELEEEEWEIIGSFMQTETKYFGGLYTYLNNNYSIAPSQLTATSNLVYDSIFYGNNGVQSGSLANVTNLSKNELITRTEIYSTLDEVSIDPNITSLANLFNNNRKITAVPNFNTSNITSMHRMFNFCFNLQRVPNFNTVNVTNAAEMFFQCGNLKTVPEFNFSKVTNLRHTFAYCTRLLEIPYFDTSNCTDMSRMCYAGYGLINVSELNTSQVANIAQMFCLCNNLSNESIQNIVNMCLNSNVTDITFKNLSNTNNRSPLHLTKFDNSYYSDRFAELDAAGWSY